MTDRKLIATLRRARGWLALTASEAGRPHSSDIHRVMAEIDAIIAQGIEAGTATTARRGAEHESPTPTGDAPSPPSRSTIETQSVSKDKP